MNTITPKALKKFVLLFFFSLFIIIIFLVFKFFFQEKRPIEVKSFHIATPSTPKIKEKEKERESKETLLLLSK